MQCEAVAVRGVAVLALHGGGELLTEHHRMGHGRGGTLVKAIEDLEVEGLAAGGEREREPGEHEERSHGFSERHADAHAPTPSNKVRPQKF